MKEGECAVCGDSNAKKHYGQLACYGCKGFFRRAIKNKHRYICRYNRECVIDKHQRNACRHCRLKRCVAVGMNPQAIQPDRDVTGRQRGSRIKVPNDVLSQTVVTSVSRWALRIPLDARSFILHLMDIAQKVLKGYMMPYSGTFPPVLSRKGSLRDIFDQPMVIIPSERYEMGHEPKRLATMEELKASGRRSVFAAADWIIGISDSLNFKSTDDKVALLKATFAPLFMFNLAAHTAQKTTDNQILCLSCSSYVPRILPPHFMEINHLANNLIGRIIDELVKPIRKMKLTEQEIVAFKAIIVLNPEAKGLSRTASRSICKLRNRAQEALFQVIRGLHPDTPTSSRFGNLLLLLPKIAVLTSVMSDNVQLANAFNVTRTGSMVAEIFGEFSCDADLLQDLDLGGSGGGKEESDGERKDVKEEEGDDISDVNIPTTAKKYVDEYTECNIAQSQQPEDATSTQRVTTMQVTNEGTQTDDEDIEHQVVSSSQLPSGSNTAPVPLSSISPVSFHFSCSELFALVNDIEPAVDFPWF